MKKIYLIGIIALLSAIMLVTPAVAKTIYVNETGWWIEGGEFNASSCPVDSAVEDNPYLEDSDTVFVYNGTYEVVSPDNDPLAIYKSITLKGEGVDVVTFDLRHPTIGNSWYIGIYHAGAEGTIVEGLKIVNTTRGIDVGAPDCIVRNCVFEGLTKFVSLGGAAATFENNVVTNATEKYDVLRVYANSTTIANNTFINNKGSHATYAGAVTLREGANNCTIVNNTITGNNGNGIWIWKTSATNNVIKKNNISANTRCGIYLKDAGIGNKIYLNNFIDNPTSVIYSGAPPATIYWNSTEQIDYVWNGTTYTDYLGNNWSDYTGVDTSPEDGIGDMPYVIPDSTDMDHRPLMVGFENYLKPAAGICGDVNKDTDVDFIDVGLVGRHKLYGDALADEWAADVNGDDSIDFVDVGLIGRHKVYGAALSCKK